MAEPTSAECPAPPVSLPTESHVHIPAEKPPTDAPSPSPLAPAQPAEPPASELAKAAETAATPEEPQGPVEPKEPVPAMSPPDPLPKPPAPPPGFHPYHETQYLYCCALHAVNTMFQKRVYYKKDFDAVCSRLHAETRKVQPFPWNIVNPHKSWMGVGNYDVNVVSKSLEEHGFELQWWDSRKPFTSLPLTSPHFLALLLNAHSNDLLSTRHFWSVREAPVGSGFWWSFDSKLDSPGRIGGTGEVVKWLEALRAKNPELEVLVAVAKPPTSTSFESSTATTRTSDGTGDGAKAAPTPPVQTAAEKVSHLTTGSLHPTDFEELVDRRRGNFEVQKPEGDVKEKFGLWKTVVGRKGKK